MIRQTSLISFKEVMPTKQSRKELVFKGFENVCHTNLDATDQEVTNWLYCEGYIKTQYPNIVRPRRFELVEDKNIFWSCERTCSITGKKAIAWSVTELVSKPSFVERSQD